MQRSALCRSRRELSNEYLLAKVGFDTAENEPCEVRKFELSEILNLNFEISKLLFAAQIKFQGHSGRYSRDSGRFRAIPDFQ